MKTTVSVIVLHPFTWKNESYTTGQSIALTPIDAIVLARKRQVTLTRRKTKPVAPAPPSPPEPEPPEPPKRRIYKRRDVQAEDLAPAIDLVQTDPEAES